MSTVDQQVEAALSLVDSDKELRLQRLFNLLKIQSISTDPAFAGECKRAAQGLSDELSEIGFDSRVVATEGHPIVLAHMDTPNEEAPRVLFYGHYDVQPVDPLDLWDGDPFEPVVLEREDGSRFIRARGASDDKAQVRTFIEACRAWIGATGELPCGVTIFLEGEEESGSPSMPRFLEEYGNELRRADIALICDTTMWDRDTPAITVSLRGTVAGEVTITGPDRDLHSGLYGGAALNPLHALTRIFAQLWTADGKVALEGFYDGVGEPDAELKAAWKDIDFDDDAFLGAVGLDHPAGENDRSVLEKIWSRPTAEINGMWGGYTGAGFKTVIPSKASAKVSFRLVPGQDPDLVWASFERFATDKLPVGASITFNKRGGDKAHAVSIHNNYLRMSLEALREEWQTEPLLIGGGGSIPIVGDLKRHLGLDSILAGFGLDDDSIHSPNEKYEMKSFERGTRSWVRLLAAFSKRC
ncbi:MAG: M20/M25/M40 family metallo-hydrolase [Pseudomonadota bacterium]